MKSLFASRFANDRLSLDETGSFISKVKTNKQRLRPQWSHNFELDAQVYSAFAHCRGGQDNKHILVE